MQESHQIDVFIGYNTFIISFHVHDFFTHTHTRFLLFKHYFSRNLTFEQLVLCFTIEHCASHLNSVLFENLNSHWTICTACIVTTFWTVPCILGFLHCTFKKKTNFIFFSIYISVLFSWTVCTSSQFIFLPLHLKKKDEHWTRAASSAKKNKPMINTV